MGTQVSAFGTWLNGVPVGIMPQTYRAYREELDRLQEESEVQRRPKGECRPRLHSESGKQRLLRTKDAARYLGMSTWALRQEVNKGELHFISSGEHTSSWKFDVRDLDAWIERHKIKY
jgi:excisionase family DNA binding protein